MGDYWEIQSEEFYGKDGRLLMEQMMREIEEEMIRIQEMEHLVSQIPYLPIHELLRLHDSLQHALSYVHDPELRDVLRHYKWCAAEEIIYRENTEGAPKEEPYGEEENTSLHLWQAR